MITLQFVRASGISSKLIAWWGSGWNGFSHVDAVLPDGRLFGARSDAIGYRPPGVWDRPQNYDPTWEAIEQIHIPADSTTTTLWLNSLLKEKGKKYDKPGIVRFLLGREPVNDGMWFCSALQESKIEERGLIHNPGVIPQGVSPDLLHAICCSHGFQREKIK